MELTLKFDLRAPSWATPAVELYEASGRNRRSVLDAAERALRG